MLIFVALLNVRLYACVHVCMCVCARVCVCMCMCMCACVYTNVCAALLPAVRVASWMEAISCFSFLLSVRSLSFHPPSISPFPSVCEFEFVYVRVCVCVISHLPFCCTFYKYLFKKPPEYTHPLFPLSLFLSLFLPSLRKAAKEAQIQHCSLSSLCGQKGTAVEEREKKTGNVICGSEPLSIRSHTHRYRYTHTNLHTRTHIALRHQLARFLPLFPCRRHCTQSDAPA